MRYTFLWILLCALMVICPVFAQDEKAMTLIDNFEQYTPESFGAWWVYDDGVGSTFKAEIDTQQHAEGDASLKIDLNLVPDGYSGMGFDYGVPVDWREGRGITFKVKASEPGLPMLMVLYLDDPTQTSPDTNGTTPFAHSFTTPQGSETDWVSVTLLWAGFERLTWMGTDGLMDFTANPIATVELAFEAPIEVGIQGTIWIDDLRVISDTDLSAAVTTTTTDLVGKIPALRLSQIGYRPEDEKIFYSNQPVGDFTIADDATGEAVYTGTAKKWGNDPDAGGTVYRGDFTALVQEGQYHVLVEGLEASFPFAISETVYDAPLLLAARAFYVQRSGIAIHDEGVSGLTLDAGHTKNAVLWDDRAVSLDVSGGWYDAGDYGRYIPTAAFTVNQLVYAFETNPDVFADGSLQIPESGNGLPDLLDEIRYETDWMLKMQRDDGAVHHKVTTRDFPGLGVLPADNTEDLFVFDVTTEDTAYFAGALAQASRAFRPYDAAYADTLLTAAQNAWAWLEAHPEQYPVGGFQNPPVSEYPMQGGYDFIGQNVTPRLFASAELLKTTSDPQYDTAFRALFVQSSGGHSMSWADFYPMALYAYLTSETANTEIWLAVDTAFRQDAAEIASVIQSTGYQVALKQDADGFHYVWGSNQQTLAHGLYLMLANELYPDETTVKLALDQIHYVLGANALAKAYITGLGSNPVQHPHHNVSVHFQKAVPGWIGEGANRESTGGDAVLEAVWNTGAPPAQSYADDWDSWASNEPTIDANATFIALLAYFAG